MKKSILFLILLLPINVNAHDYSSSFKFNDKCYQVKKNETYIKGNDIEYGYLHKWKEYKQINCNKHVEGTKDKIIKVNRTNNIFMKKFENLKLWINEKYSNKFLTYPDKNLENIKSN